MSADRERADAGQAFTGKLDPATLRILPSASATHVHLLRHGAVEAMTDRVVRGQLDVQLSSGGAVESRLLSAWLAHHEPRPDVVFTSDLVRCTALADDFGAHIGHVPVRDVRLREQSMGAWEGRTWADITAGDPRAVTAYWNDYHRARPTGGESFADLEERVIDWWRDAIAAYAGKRIVVATHIGVIRALLCHWLGVPGDQALRFAPATASHTAVTIGEAGAVVMQFGERPWLAQMRERVSHSSAVPISRVGKPRVALSGSAGTGKTTLGRRLARELGVPFLEEIMRKRLEAGFDFHGMTPSDWRALMSEQWQEQRALEEAQENGFVSDRSSLDYAAFFLHYDLHLDVDAEPWLDAMARESERYDRILLFPWGALPLEDDGVRSTNRWTQLRFQSILEGLVERYARSQVLRVPALTDFDARLDQVLAALSPLKITAQSS
jgi:broad specificity phosphatase PhoE/nicotinamide riboside kinase